MRCINLEEVALDPSKEKHALTGSLLLLNLDGRNLTVTEEIEMKRIFLSALLGVGILTATFQIFSRSSEARMPEDYPLVCRGGGSLVIGIAPGERNIGFVFTRGTKPAGQGLAPGECSWVDRGMYPSEPDRVSQHVEEGSESLKVGGKLAPENRWFEELHSADKYWTFMVSNNGRGQLIASSARPNQEMNVSPTARVPSTIERIIRPDLPKAGTPGNEIPKRIVLSGPTGPSSGMEVMKGSAGGRSINVPPAPRAFSTEEKTELLKSAGFTFKELPNSYVTLTAQYPQLEGRGALEFHNSELVQSGKENYAMFYQDAPYHNGRVTVNLNFDNRGIYLMTLTVSSVTDYPVAVDPAEFVFTRGMYYTPEGTTQTFTGTVGTQRLNIIIEVAEPGQYQFHLEDKVKNLWFFYSCEVTKFKTQP